MTDSAVVVQALGERTGQEVAVVAAAEFLARILEDAPQALWVVDDGGRILFANPVAVSTLGYDHFEELRGRSSHDTVHYRRLDGSPYPERECPMLEPRQTGETTHGEDWFVRRDGSMFPIAWWSAPFAMADGNGAVLAFTDISERRVAEQVVRERDAAEIRAAESRAAQRRIVESAAAARRRIARDLHDGAQQRLITMLIGMQLTAEEIEAGSGEAAALLDDALEQARSAIAELHQLAAGVYPGVLTTHGLRAAVEELAGRSGLPVAVAGAFARRLPETVETNAYFFVAEALTNTMKHARAARVAVTMSLDDAVFTVEVRDDGIGGAGAGGAGSGLAGLVDRIGALGGRVVVSSPPGGGTAVRAEMPVGPR